MVAQIHISPEIEAVRSLYGPEEHQLDRDKPISDRLARQADILFIAHQAGNTASTFQIASWHPNLVGKSPAEILQGEFLERDARMTIAREYGYVDWNEVAALGKAMLDLEFEDAVDAALEGDVSRLLGRVEARPGLAVARSGYGHRASLLHYLSANGVESWRQVVPSNAPETIELVIRAGGDVNAEAPIYGGSRPLGLVATSAHPRDAGLADEMMAVLHAAGAV